MKKSLLGIVLSVLALAANAQETKAKQSTTPQKQGGIVAQGARPSWRISDEERIVARTEFDRQRGSVRATTAGRMGYVENIDGREHPELFLAFELFDHLLLGLSADESKASNAHTLYDHKLALFGYDTKGFWDSLRSAAQPYLMIRQDRDKNGPHHVFFTTPSGQRTFVGIAPDACAARIAALGEARRHLGGENFDRFLYAAVAPEVGTSASGTAPNRADQLRYLAGGCK